MAASQFPGVWRSGWFLALSRRRRWPSTARHGRYVWNLAVEQQHQHWQPGRRAPGYNEQCSQLTAAHAEYDWLAAGSHTVQQQALRDFAQAMGNFLARTHRRPRWRK